MALLPLGLPPSSPLASITAPFPRKEHSDFQVPRCGEVQACSTEPVQAGLRQMVLAARVSTPQRFKPRDIEIYTKRVKELSTLTFPYWLLLLSCKSLHVQEDCMGAESWEGPIGKFPRLSSQHPPT